MTKNYDHNSIKVLKKLEPLQKSPGMFIGSTEHATHLVTEAFDNSQDEAIAGHATLIAVIIDTQKKEYTIIDNGRGIPFKNDTIIKVASELFSGGKFDKSENDSYGIACLKGDTKIMLLDGRHVTIQYMAEHSDEEFWVLSSTTDGKWIPEKVISPSITGYTNELIRVHIDNETYVDCTFDHKFLMRDGTYKEAKDLQSDDSLMPCYMKEINGYTCIRPNNTYEYIRNIKFENRSYRRLCKYVYEYFYGVVLKGYAIHHKDLDRKNDILKNLECLHNQTEHCKCHTKELYKRGIINCDGLIKYNKSIQGRLKSFEMGLNIGTKNLLKYSKSKKNRLNKSRMLKKFNKIKGIQEQLQFKKVKKYLNTLLLQEKEITNIIWDKYRPYGIPSFNKTISKYESIENIKSQLDGSESFYLELKETNGCEMIIKRVMSIFSKLEKNNLPLTINNYNKIKSKFCPGINAINKYFKSFDNCIKYYKKYNHKVVKTEKIFLEKKIPVYDIHTPINHNFVLSNGTIVHNSGLHGVGIVAITALSDYLTIDVIRDKTHAHCKWIKGELKTEGTETAPFKEKEAPFSTRITFKPCKKYFGSIDIDADYILKRMKLASVYIPSLTLALIVDGKREKISCNMEQYFNNEILLNNDKKHFTQQKELLIKIEKEELQVRWCYCLNGSPTPKHHGCVNILAVDSGTHIDETNRIFREVLFNFAKKKKMVINKQDCLVGFRSLTSILLFKPEFSSQNKERFSKNKADLKYLYDELKIKLEEQLLKDEDLLSTLLLHFESYRKRLDSTKTIVKTGDTVSRTSSTIGGKLRDCTTHSVSKSELFIVEGDGAAGTLIAARDPRIHAVLPLRGKSIPNVAAIKDSSQILKKKGKGRSSTTKKSELIELINACGTGMEPDFHIEGIRYGKIVIAADADSDGNHISSIIMTAFLKLMPEIIKRGHLYICQMPLYGVRDPKKFIPFYSEEEMIKYRDSHPKEHILRFKGLGEMNSKQLGMCMLELKTRRLIQIQYPEDSHKLLKLMVDAEMKRAIV